MGADQRPHSDPGGMVCGVWGHPHRIALELCSVGTERGTVFGGREGEPSWIQACPCALPHPTPPEPLRSRYPSCREPRSKCHSCRISGGHLGRRTPFSRYSFLDLRMFRRRIGSSFLSVVRSAPRSEDCLAGPPFQVGAEIAWAAQPPVRCSPLQPSEGPLLQSGLPFLAAVRAFPASRPVGPGAHGHSCMASSVRSGVFLPRARRCGP